MELAWGFMESVKIDEWRLRAVGRIREVLDSVLRLLQDYEIPATWALLGHLFLDKCERKERPHSEIPRPSYAWFEGDWFKYDPCTDIERDPLWYGKDIVEKILDFSSDSVAEQEIACHSFSHPVFGDPGCSKEFARAEIDKCLAIMKGYETRPRTFVFPLGSVGHVRLLKERGFTAFFSGISQLVKGSSLGRLAPSAFHRYVSSGIELLSNNSLLSPPVSVPEMVLPGLWAIPGSMCFNKKRNVPLKFVVLRAKRGIERAIREKACFYMYTHLHNFGVDSGSLLHSFENILRYVDEKRQVGELQVTNVQELVRSLEH